MNVALAALVLFAVLLLTLGVGVLAVIAEEVES